MIKLTSKNKLVGGFALAVAAVLATGATGTVAWFTANRAVSLNYTKVTVGSVSNNLQIGYNNLQNAVSNDVGLKSGDITASGNVFLTDVSSGDGLNFYRKWGGIGNTWNMQKIEYGTKSGDDTHENPYFSQFYVTLKNSGNAPANVYFDGGNSHIEDNVPENGTATGVSDFVRVAVSEAQTGNSVEKKFYTSKFVFMDTTTSTETSNKYADEHSTITIEAGSNSEIGDSDDVVTMDMDGLKPIPDTVKFVRDVNAASTDSYTNPLLATANSKTTDTNFVATLAKEESRYVVVTVWFEGTEKANQNEYLKASFDLKLAFVAQDVTTETPAQG